VSFLITWTVPRSVPRALVREVNLPLSFNDQARSMLSLTYSRSVREAENLRRGETRTLSNVGWGPKHQVGPLHFLI
jgi:hypothetical protein